MGAGGHKEGGKRAPWLAGVKVAGGTQGQTLGRHVGRPPRATAVRAAPASARLFNQRPARAPSRALFRGGGARAGPAPSPAPPPRGLRPAQALRLAGGTVTARCALRNSVLRALRGRRQGRLRAPRCQRGWGLCDSCVLLVLVVLTKMSVYLITRVGKLLLLLFSL